MKYVAWALLFAGMLIFGCCSGIDIVNPRVEMPVGGGKSLTVENVSGWAFDSNRGIEQCFPLLEANKGFYNTCIYFIAGAEKNPEICSKTIKVEAYDSIGGEPNITATDENYAIRMDQCIYHLAEKGGAGLIEWCSALSKQKKAECYLSYFDEMPAACNRIMNQTRKDDCLHPSYCDMFKVDQFGVKTKCEQTYAKYGVLAIECTDVNGTCISFDSCSPMNNDPSVLYTYESEPLANCGFGSTCCIKTPKAGS